MEELIEEIKKFNEERDWDKFHSPENLAKTHHSLSYNLLYFVLTPLAFSTGYFFFVFSNFFNIISLGSISNFIQFNKSAILDIEQNLIRMFYADTKFASNNGILNKNKGQSSNHNYYQREMYLNKL